MWPLCFACQGSQIRRTRQNVSESLCRTAMKKADSFVLALNVSWTHRAVSAVCGISV